MPLDAMCLTAVRRELEERIKGARAEKIRQPERDMIIITVRGREKAENLLISAGTGDMRVHITGSKFENPQEAPMFCMLLRKHLTGSRITEITQPEEERVLEIKFLSQDVLGDLGEKTLVIELIGGSTNIILVGQDGLIIDSLRRVGGGINDKRRVLPGLKYELPERQTGKKSPFGITEEMWHGLYENAREGTVDKWLLGKFAGLSPLISREVTWRAYGAAEKMQIRVTDGGSALRRELCKLMDSVKAGKFTACMLTDDENNPREFSYTRILQYESALNITEKGSFSELLEEFYTKRGKAERMTQKASAMTKTVKNAREKQRRKLEAQRIELEKTREREYLRECGELLTANLYRCEKGMKEVEVEDYYAEDGKSRKISLDERKTPQENAARYFRDYKKAKTAEKYLTEQIKSGENEVIYLESVLEEIALCETEGGLLEIREELRRTGYIKTRKGQSERKIKSAAPMKFVSSTGYEIYAGRSNIQNDELTLKMAARNDIWLHAKGYHGSHVIIKSGVGEADETALREAAVIAAWYSKAREAGKTAVDYCLVKNVKKPSGGRPGAVIYTDYKTIFASPDETLVKRIQIV